MVPELFVPIDSPGIVNKVSMAVHTLFGITWASINDRPMCQHGPPFLGNVQQIPVALLALLVLERGIGLLAVFFMIVSVLRKMNGDVFEAMPGLRVEEIECVVRGWQVTIHAVGHKTLGIVHMARGLPGVVGETDLMAPRTKLRCGCADHGVVGEAEKGKGNYQTDGYEDGRFYQFLHAPLLVLEMAGVVVLF
jgi:hypothetical protein